MTSALVIQGVASVSFVVMLIAFLATRGKSFGASSTIKQLLLWYPLSAPWLLVRTPILYILVDTFGVALWAAVVVEFIIERPLFYLTAREIAHRVE